MTSAPHCMWSVPPLARRCAAGIEAELRDKIGSSARAEMRPGGTRGAERAEWFLRSRGDAPTLVEYCRATVVVPPLARRCADSRDQWPWTRVGSSARAEMRPSEAGLQATDDGFLRSRGDAPHLSREVSRKVLVPPLARRCAFFRCRLLFAGVGSSARAEMRPCEMLPRGAGIWFLRSRGDAPHLDTSGSRNLLVPPLARRCAPRYRRMPMKVYGSSARAEMRPLTGTVGDTSTSVPPLARRCASSMFISSAPIKGSSARAEMRPTARIRRSA